MSITTKKTYVFAGASQRALRMFMNPMNGKYKDYCFLAGVYDINPGRAEEISKRTGIKVYEDFEEMVKAVNPRYRSSNNS